MSDIKTIYTDGVGKIHFFGNMLRLDLMDFVPSESDDANFRKWIRSYVFNNANLISKKKKNANTGRPSILAVVCTSGFQYPDALPLDQVIRI